MKCRLATKKNVKDALDTVKKSRTGDDRTKTASIQCLTKQFENLVFRDGESVGDFTMRINGLIASLRELGENLPDSRMVKKVLRVVPRRLKQVAVALEMLGDLDNMSIEELVGRLQIVEEADAEKPGESAQRGAATLVVGGELNQLKSGESHSPLGLAFGV
jgi:hypothetical protein